MGPPKREDFVVVGLLLASMSAVYIVLRGFTVFVGDDPDSRYWFTSLIFNLLGYSTIFLPGMNICARKFQS